MGLRKLTLWLVFGFVAYRIWNDPSGAGESTRAFLADAFGIAGDGLTKLSTFIQQLGEDPSSTA